MAKILVADDNSNVQKTVALALADLGFEVVAVNNGEAAVRKLADVSPDLVLADIFMPVRNGYEVCEYVKNDARFSHVPVVLLVGAFDPLDEREAQRVGADGILKKPFVPPDPLIAMVKTLLDRALSERLVAVAISNPAVSTQGKSGGIATAEEPPTATETSEESREEELQPPVNRLSFGEGERPIAFGQLLETPAKESAATDTEVVEPVSDEQILTSSRDASLGDPIFWRTEDPKPEAEENNSETEEDISSGLPLRPWKLSDDVLPGDAKGESLQPVEPFELVREEKDEEPGQASTIVESWPIIGQDAAAQASLTVDSAKPEDLAANPIEWMASAPPPPAEQIPEAAQEWGAAIPEAAQTLDAIEAANFGSATEPVAPEPLAAIEAPFTVSNSAPALPSATPPEAPQAKIDAQIPDPHKTQPSLKPMKQGPEDTARSVSKQDWVDLAASLQPKPIEPIAETPSPAAAPAAQALPVPATEAQPVPASVATIPAATTANAEPAAENSAPPASPDPALVEAVVQRILDKMRPQVVDIITREFLRPIVQALVHREIQKR